MSDGWGLKPRVQFLGMKIPLNGALLDTPYLNEYDSVDALRRSLKRYFHFYNLERPHQSFDGATPAEVYYGRPTRESCALVDESCGPVRAETCGSPMDNDEAVAHSATTLPGLSPTGHTGSTMALS